MKAEVKTGNSPSGPDLLTELPEPDISKLDVRDSGPVTGAESLRAIERLNRTLRSEGAFWTAIPVEGTKLDRSQATDAAALARVFAKLFGRRVVIFDSANADVPNGIVNTSRELRDVIFLHNRAERPHMLTVGHEIYHHIEISAPALARDIRAQLEPLLRDGAQIEREKGGHDPERRYHEIAGDIFGDALADPSFWDRLNAANPTTFRKVAFVVKDWLSKAIRFLRANGYQSNRYLTDIERAHEVVAAALGKFAEKPFADSSLNLEPYDPNQNFYEGDSKEKAPEFDSGSKRSPEQLKKLRANYVGEASALRETKEKMLEAGDSLEKVARTLHRMRNDLKLKYRDLTPEGEVLRFEERVVSP